MTDGSARRQPARTTLDIDLGNGQTVQAEVFLDSAPPRAPGAGYEDTSGVRDWFNRQNDAVLARTGPTISAMAQWVHDQVEGLQSARPQRIGVEMGIKLVAKTTGIVAPVIGQVGGESTLLVRLEWDLGAAPGAPRPPAQDPGDQDDDDEPGG